MTVFFMRKGGGKMIRTTQKEIRAYLNGKNNLNGFTSDEINEIKKYLRCVAMSFGVYGMNGGLFQDTRTGDFFVVPNRSTRLFQLC